MTTDPSQWVYGNYAPDQHAQNLIGLKARWILRQLPALQTPAVLDFGSGEGKYLHLIRSVRPGARLVGVDVQVPRTPADFEFHVVQQDSTLPFPDDSFDIIVSCDVLEHVAQVGKSLDEIQRVLRPGGKFIGFVPLEGGPGPHAFFRVFAPDIYRATKDHRHAYSRREMMNLVLKRFDTTDIAYSYHFLGGSLDALFFASFTWPGIGKQVERYWRGQENSFYRTASPNAKPSLIGKLAGFANRVAYWESRLLHGVPFGANGLHFSLEKKT